MPAERIIAAAYLAWERALVEARMNCDLDVCLELRRQDAEAHGIPTHLALNEERAWHAQHCTP
jgi:hypothetical protein